jgi:hypothetical protein
MNRVWGSLGWGVIVIGEAGGPGTFCHVWPRSRERINRASPMDGCAAFFTNRSGDDVVPATYIFPVASEVIAWIDWSPDPLNRATVSALNTPSGLENPVWASSAASGKARTDNRMNAVIKCPGRDKSNRRAVAPTRPGFPDRPLPCQKSGSWGSRADQGSAPLSVSLIGNRRHPAFLSACTFRTSVSVRASQSALPERICCRGRIRGRTRADCLLPGRVSL